eukprot:scaffold176860_cov26-Attheya_sp.AAC.1
MRAFKQAADEAPRHANRAETNDFINAIKEASNLPTKKTLAIVKSYFKSQGSTCDSLGHVWAGVQNGDMEDLAVAEMNRCTFENMSDTDDEEDQIKPSYLDYMPYIFFAQTDGGPDQTTT